MITTTSPSKTTPFIEPAGDPDQVQLDSVLYIEAVVARAP